MITPGVSAPCPARLVVLFSPTASAICRIDGPSPYSAIQRRTTPRISSSSPTIYDRINPQILTIARARPARLRAALPRSRASSISHVRRIPPHHLGPVGHVPEPVSDAIPHRHAGVGRDEDHHARLEQQGPLTTRCVATRVAKEPCSHASTRPRSPDRTPCSARTVLIS